MKEFLLIFLFITSVANAKPIKIVFMEDYEPVSFISPVDGRAIGIAPDIIREAFSDKGIQLELVGYPWMRAQEMVRRGDADAMVSIVTPERLTYTNASEFPAFYDTNKAYTYVGHLKIDELKKAKGVTDLKKFTFCDYRGNGWGKANIVGQVKKIEWGTSIDMKVGMLAAHRCDVIVDLGFIVLSTAKRNHFEEQIVELPVSFEGTTFRLLVGKKSLHQDLLSEFDKRAKIMHEKKITEKIILKWTPELHTPYQ